MMAVAPGSVANREQLPWIGLLSGLELSGDAGAVAGRVFYGQRDGEGACFGVNVADILAFGRLAVAERPAERHDRALGLPAFRAAEADFRVRFGIGGREAQDRVRPVDARLLRPGRAGLLGAGGEERLRAAGDQQLRRDASAVGRVGDGGLFDALVVAPDQLGAVRGEAGVQILRVRELTGAELDLAGQVPVGRDVLT